MKFTRRMLSAGPAAPFAFATPEARPQHPDTPAAGVLYQGLQGSGRQSVRLGPGGPGCEPIMETLKETAQANSLYLVALMHHELRPLTDFYFPHNSRKTYFPEDSRVYWFPTPTRVLQIVTGTCFCDSCVTAAKAEGFDLKAAQRACCRWPAGCPPTTTWPGSTTYNCCARPILRRKRCCCIIPRSSTG